MSPARKALEGLRAATVTVGGPVILLVTVAASVRSAMRALLRGRRPSLHPLNGLRVRRFEPGHEIALEGWGSFAVEPLDGDRSRVACRGEPHRNPLFAVYYTALIELPHFLMERRMLLGIKERVERAAPR